MSSSASKKVIFAALAGNAAIAVTKFVAATVTGSAAMLSEGIHSLVDTGNQALLLFGIRRAARPADESFPFGHGKEIYFWSFVVAILIFAVGSGVSIYEGVRHLVHPRHSDNPGINYLVLGFAVIFEGIAWLFAFKEFRRVKGRSGYLQAVREGKDPSIFVVLFEDSAALLGLLVAFLGVWLAQVTGEPRFDAAASLVIGLILGGTAVWLAVETKSLLIGESAAPEVVRGIRILTKKYEIVEHVNEVLTLHMGPEYILVNMSIDFRDECTAEEIESEITRLDAEIKEGWPLVKRIFIEAEARRKWSR